MPENNGSSFFQSRLWAAFCFAAILLVFAFDSLTPRGFAHGNLYFSIVLLAALSRNERLLLLTGCLSGLFTVLGYFISPAGFDVFYVLLNRGLSLLEIALLTGLSIFLVRQLNRVRESNKDLRASRDRVSEQDKLLGIAGNALKMGGWMVNLPDYRISWSERVRQIHQVSPGYTPDIDTALQFYAPEYRQRIQEVVRACAEEGIPFDEEAEIITANGKPCWVRVIGRAEHDFSGRITRIQGAFLDISSDKEVESMLLSLQRHFRQFADALPLIVWTSDNDARIDFANRALLDYAGGKLEDYLETGWISLVPEEDLPPTMEAFGKAVATGQKHSAEFRLRRLDGAYRWHQIEAHPVRSEDGKIEKWCGIALDVHDNKVIEERFREQARNLITTLESISDAFLTLDRDWRCIYINKAAEEMLHRKREDLLGKNIWSMFPEAEHFRAHYSKSMEQGITAEFKEYYEPLQKWFAVRSYPSPQGIAVYFRDITRQQQLDEAMRQNRERFENVARATTDAIWDWDLTSNQVWWNESYEILFGHSLAGRAKDASSWTDYIHPDDKDAVLDSIHQAIDGKLNGWQHDYRFRRHDGSYAWVSDSGFIIRDDQGKAMRMVGGMRDITESRLLQERLNQSQRLEAIGQLTGGVAHDFNNLLTVIQGNAELLTESLQADSEQRQLAEMVSTAAEKASQLTRHLLAFARRQPLEPQAADIRLLLNQMEPLLRRSLPENIEIEIVHGGGLWPAMIDTTRLENAILNLCLNARDAMPAGGRLTIETANVHLDRNYADEHIEVNPGQYVQIAVSDTGSGIAANILDKVFEPFFTTKGSEQGSGMGLSMVYGFIKQSGGHVKIYSEEAQGSTVRMYLPKASSEAVSVRKDSAQAAVMRGNESVLLVEDDELVRVYAKKLLQDLGYTVYPAAHAGEALEILESRDDIVLLFTDIVMPGGMNGRQLADQAQALRPGLKVLYTSGYTENAVVHHGRLDAGVELISKPYTRKDLASRLRQVLGK